MSLPPPPFPAASSWARLVDAALEEDVGSGDATSLALLPGTVRGTARLEARGPLVVAGLPLAARVFERLGARVTLEVAEAASARHGDVLARVEGATRDVLTAERTALNFLSRLCAVATHTRRFVDACAGTDAVIVDTRKTTPGWRVLEKYAVRCGGGVNHRFGLYDGILIKDNHIAATGGVAEAVRRARRDAPAGLRILVEVESVEDARSALDCGAELLMVDNQPPPVVEKVVELCAGRVPVEATGGVTLESVAQLARTGVDRISVGGLTHNPPPVDVALEWLETSSS